MRELEAAVRGVVSQLPAAEARLRDWLHTRPGDVVALRLLGKLCMRLARYEEAEEQFLSVLEHASDDNETRWLLAGTFVYRGDWKKALDATERVLEHAPDNSQYLDVQAFCLLHLGESEAALAGYEVLVANNPIAENWKSYGQALKALGRTEDAIAAFRQALAIDRTYGMAYWCLAELKTFRFDFAEIDAMRQALDRPDLRDRNRAQLQFALGRAYEGDKQYAESFEQFRQANATMRSFVRHNPDQRSDFVQRNKAVFTPDFFHARSGWGSPATDAIFILGLPRSGSTLIEQILASHSQVEATSELQTLESLIRDFSMRKNSETRRYPELMQDLSLEQVARAGEEYLERTRVYRKLGRPFFTDKMPNNFSYLGMILTALPNAKVVDARRHPLASGFAIYKHYFVDAYSYAFDLADIGRYYRDYAELMAHFDAVHPGRVHRVFHENLVADPEGEIRKLLAYCGLPFEEQCLRFYETERAVLTPSAEQVRQPISADAVDLWRRYERWLEPLKSALGDVLERHPEVPVFRGVRP